MLTECYKHVMVQGNQLKVTRDFKDFKNCNTCRKKKKIKKVVLFHPSNHSQSRKTISNQKEVKKEEKYMWHIHVLSFKRLKCVCIHVCFSRSFTSFRNG
ncbi:CLUMA_CG020484, isoform A [Clunio marinus]|uniref:CLUMA_CG020484, isoform A n=1 Tax=Clunio marinus TaxID=568069 RepID=A0A1J1J552_9DIPT|nr:CLUMA_CG020484, isoform A [Clunio marinus]